jgi:hypothetical protein
MSRRHKVRKEIRRCVGLAGIAILLAAGEVARESTAIAQGVASSPSVKEIPIPPFEDATAIWGATGRDSKGRIWIGVSASSPGMAAHLMELDPGAGIVRDRGAVLDQLKIVGRYVAGQGQVKIHTKLVSGADGGVYFASTDEDGEAEDGSAPPRWGGHAWRLDAATRNWKHLFATNEGLVAASAAGRYVYYLGYFNHVLFQYDTVTGDLRRLVVGSIAGHVSRNFLADANGHAYVPRLVLGDRGEAIAELVEFGPGLDEVGVTPLEFYLGGGEAGQNHGITAVMKQGDGKLYFLTARGYLYEVQPRNDRAAAVRPIGWFHPDGESYAPSLFATDDPQRLVGVTQRGVDFAWVVYDLASRRSIASRFDTNGLQDVLLYGSETRDDQGRYYLVGWAGDGRGGQRPLLLQVGAAR